jgi:hypothetical protein
VSFNLDDLLNELEAEEAVEKTAAEVTGDAKSVSGNTETTKKAEAAPQDSTQTATEEVAEEKVAETAADSQTSSTQANEPLDEKVAELVETTLVKSAEEFGKIAALSFFGELVAMGIAMPTNKDMMVPPISAVSQPSESPTLIASENMQKKASFVDQDFIKNLKNKIYGGSN